MFKNTTLRNKLINNSIDIEYNTFFDIHTAEELVVIYVYSRSY